MQNRDLVDFILKACHAYSQKDVIKCLISFLYENTWAFMHLPCQTFLKSFCPNNVILCHPYVKWFSREIADRRTHTQTDGTDSITEVNMHSRHCQSNNLITSHKLWHDTHLVNWDQAYPVNHEEEVNPSHLRSILIMRFISNRVTESNIQLLCSLNSKWTI